METTSALKIRTTHLEEQVLLCQNLFLQLLKADYPLGVILLHQILQNGTTFPHNEVIVGVVNERRHAAIGVVFDVLLTLYFTFILVEIDDFIGVLEAELIEQDDDLPWVWSTGGEESEMLVGHFCGDSDEDENM